MTQSDSLVSGIALAPGVYAAAADLHFQFARSGGPGGQNVNKVNTKAELRVRPAALRGLSARARARLNLLGANRLTAAGELLFVSEVERSQFANKEACVNKLRALVAAALKEPKLRRKTKPTWGSQQRRIEAKKAHSRIKAQRRGPEE